MSPAKHSLVHFERRHPIIWAVGLAALIVGLYLPTLATRFDFIDDGSLVYPHGDRSPPRLLARVWQTTQTDFQQRGPFRPVLWAHLVTAAEWFGADAVAWRGAHLAWALLAAACVLWLFRELGIHPAAACLTAALAMWNPYRGEAWINLTVTEAVAMPYVLAALACAVRAARDPAWARWDVVGGLCMLAALGCKNTFAAVVPAQLVLRVAADGRPFREGWKLHRSRAILLATTLLLPVAHFLAYKVTWHPGRYETGGASLAQLWRMVRTVRGALSLEFLAPGLACAGWALWRARREPLSTTPSSFRVACLAGVVLLVCGIGIYLPIDGVAGRYAMPAVWGADLLVAVLLSRLMQSPASRWRTGALVALGFGLCAVAVANLGKQDKFNARAALLWQALECVECEARPGNGLAWHSGAELNLSEAIHFQHHLHARGHAGLSVLVVDRGECRALGPGSAEPLYALSERSELPAAGRWQLLREFRISYWGRMRGYRCYLFRRLGTPGDPP